ncbi:diguanylate cyclase [Yersinia nurmii]|uniref:diguanylate cyclase n=1 Tax=Yersinia nurmii TaxID=685706 RepID=A0AAW7JWZ5_9GAMM|nr:diguanylate cyclase [Yersinia nurmii]MDN0087517.1 diguanylate cyclase [Yersinia nurmii]
MRIRAIARNHSYNVLLNIALISGLVYLLALFCIQLSETSSNLAPLWFPTAILMVALFHLRLRYWPLQLLVAGAAIILANMTLYGPSWFSVPLTLINLVESTVGAWLLRRLLMPKDPLHSLFSWLKFVLTAVLLIPMLSGFAAAFYLAPEHGDLDQLFTLWFMSESIGMLALAPVGLLYQQGYFNSSLRSQTLFEMIWMLILSLICCYLALTYLPFPFTFIVMALIWVAIRLPRLEAFIICCLSTVLIALMMNFNLFTNQESSQLFIQAFAFIPLLLVLVPPHAMSMVMHAFRTEKDHIIESENRFRNAMEYSAIGMALVSPEGKWIQVNKALCNLLGYSQEKLLNLTFQEITYPEDLTADLKLLEDLFDGVIPSYTMEKRYIRSDGEVVWALLVVSVVRDHEQRPLYFISQVEDINDLKKTEMVNRRLMERITLANEAGGVGIWEWDLKENAISWDKRMFELYDLPPNTIPSVEAWRERIHPDDLARIDREFATALTHRQPYRLEYRIVSRSGQISHIRNQANMICDSRGDILRLIGTALDLTEVKSLTEALHEEKERLHITLDSIGEAVISTDREMHITFMNPVAEKMTGWANTIALGQPIDQIIHLIDSSTGLTVENPVWYCLNEVSPPQSNLSLILHSRDGERYDIKDSVAPLKTLEGETVGAVLVFQDVSESREIMRKLSYSASHDNLTSLPNRANFEYQLKNAIQKSIEHNQQHVLGFLDLDRFKAVNDTAGHAAGDALLKELSALMRKYLRASDCVARLGGDEFGLLLQNCSVTRAKTVVRGMVSLINDYPFCWEGKQYRIGASAGITQINSQNCKRSELMEQADIACYTAKHSGRGQVYLYQPRQKQLLARQHELPSKDEILHILEDNQLELLATAAAPPLRPNDVAFYQMIPSVIPNDKLAVSQDDFLSASLLYGLRPAMEKWICHQLLCIQGENIQSKALKVAVALSEESLQEESFRHFLLDSLQQSAIPASDLHWFIQESTLLRHSSTIDNFIARLQMLGCKLILTDFSANMNGFSRLTHLKMDYLKLDAGLIANIHTDQMDEVMVSIINGTAHRAGVKTLAGPADQLTILNKLCHIGVDLVDGDSIARTERLTDILDCGYLSNK